MKGSTFCFFIINDNLWNQASPIPRDILSSVPNVNTHSLLMAASVYGWSWRLKEWQSGSHYFTCWQDALAVNTHLYCLTFPHCFDCQRRKLWCPQSPRNSLCTSRPPLALTSKSWKLLHLMPVVLLDGNYFYFIICYIEKKPYWIPWINGWASYFAEKEKVSGLSRSVYFHTVCREHNFNALFFPCTMLWEIKNQESVKYVWMV